MDTSKGFSGYKITSMVISIKILVNKKIIQKKKIKSRYVFDNLYRDKIIEECDVYT